MRLKASYLSKVANFNLPHLHLVLPCLSFAKIFGIRQLESMGYRAASFTWSYV